MILSPTNRAGSADFEFLLCGRVQCDVRSGEQGARLKQSPLRWLANLATSLFTQFDEYQSPRYDCLRYHLCKSVSVRLRIQDYAYHRFHC